MKVNDVICEAPKPIKHKEHTNIQIFTANHDMEDMILELHNIKPKRVLGFKTHNEHKEHTVE